MTRRLMFPRVECAVAGRCAACSWISLPYDEQLVRKREAVRAAWSRAGLDARALGPIPIASVAPAGTRDRVDVQFRQEEGGLRFGFLSEGELVSVDRCPQASPALDRWIAVFRELVPPVRRGGARLRVAPDGRRGVWLDLANLDVKMLFEEKESLQRLVAEATVEIGQRRKRLVLREGVPKLVDPEPYPWFQTLAGDAKVPVYSSVGGFTQPGFAGNATLVVTVLKAIPEGRGRWVELGAGVGNFTVPLAARGLAVTAVENDPIALLGLRRTLEWQLTTAPGIYEESFTSAKTSWADLLSASDGVLADPPRSGLGNFPAALRAAGPKHLVYVSCFPESLAADAAKLLAAGYRLETLEGVDQFPQTPHLELVARFTR